MLHNDGKCKLCDKECMERSIDDVCCQCSEDLYDPYDYCDWCSEPI